MSAPPSLTKRIAFRTASSSDTWYEPNGMSPTTSGRRDLPRDGPREEQHLVDRHRNRRPLVAEHDHRGRVADEDDVDAGVLGEACAGRVVGGDHDDLVAAALHRGELGERQLSGGWGAHAGAPSRTTLSIRRTPPTRTRRRGRVGRRARPRRSRRRSRRAGAARAAGSRVASARGSAGCAASLLGGREQSVARREREAVLVAHGGDDAELELEVEVADHPAHDLDLLRVLLAEVGRVRPDDVEELAADRGDGPEVPRPELALEHRAQLGHVDPGLEARRGTSPRPAARRGGRRRRRPRSPASRASSRG